MVSKASDLAPTIEILYESGYVASLVASGIKKNYPKASIKLTPGGCGTYFEISIGKDSEKKLIHSKKNGDGEPDYDKAEDFVSKLCKKIEA